MKASRPIAAGEEVLIDYGAIPRADLLRRYGFASDDYAQYDVVELSLSNVCQAAGLSSDDVESQPTVFHSPFPLMLLSRVTQAHCSSPAAIP